jgi:type II secretory pathway component GspD/PulD (secretin)
MLKKIYVFIGIVVGIFCFFFFSLNHAMAQPTKTMKIPVPMPSTATQAGSGNPLEKKISYYVLQQTVGLAIQDIATQINLPVVIAHNVKGKIAAGKYEGTARDILNQMMADSNLHWYFDGRSIQVTSVQDAVMHVVQLNSFSFGSLEMALHTINLDTRGFPIRYDAHNNMAIIYGPPKYVATIEVVAHHLATRASQKPEVIRG